MPLKPIFDKAPLMAMNALPLRAGLVRMENPAMNKLYQQIEMTNNPTAFEGAFRLACVVSAKPGETPVAAKIRAMLSSQKDDGSFMLSFKESVAVLRAAWAMYEYEARKPQLEYIARWCAYAVQRWDELMADDDIWAYPADLLELLENLYRVTGKSSVLTLCERVANQTMGWSSVMNTFSNQRPSSKATTKTELADAITKENGRRDGYYTRFQRTNHAESLADGARSTMMKGWYSGSATELNATANGWERLYRHHGAVCGGLTSDELVEGTSPASLVSSAALGAWAEALCAAALTEKNEWAYAALERMAFNAMPATLQGDEIAAFQRVNALNEKVDEDVCFWLGKDHAERCLNRMARGYAALASSVVTVREEGADINLYMPGRFAVPVEDELVIFTMKASGKAAEITVHCKKETEATVRLRMPAWSRSTEVRVNGADNHKDVRNGMMSFDRTWHDGDVINLSFEQTLYVEDGHHQGKAIYRGPVLMALPVVKDNWQQAFVSVSEVENRVTAELAAVKDWKQKADVPADLPVLPETGEVAEFALAPYARTTDRIALFPGRKQA